MIERLYIKNYLIIKEANIEFTPGLNILTGETGAGKSIIIDALSLILGERADYSIIRDKDDKLIVEGILDFAMINKNKKFVRDNEIIKFLRSKNIPSLNEDKEEYNTIIIRRELFKKGISRSFINDYPISINDLKKFGKLIIDIHSQNEHQLLLDKNTHILQLDEYVKREDKNFNSLYEEYEKYYLEYKNIIEELKDLINRKNEFISRKEFLEFQLREINNINPQEKEDEILEKELSKLENVEEITHSVSNCLELLSGERINIIGNIHFIIKEIRKLIQYDIQFSDILKDLETVYTILKELNNSLSNYITNIDFNNARIEEIRERLGQISFLKKKYRMTINELIEKSEQLKKDLNFAENYDFEIEKKEKESNLIKEKLKNIAIEISNVRKRIAKKMEEKIKKYFNDVGLENAEFLIKFWYNKKSNDKYFDIEFNGNNNKIETTISNLGIDEVEFYINTNVVEKKDHKISKNNNLDQNNKEEEFYFPLKKVASGGEISRIMLSIKAVLSDKDKVPILVFDEIDSGVSGRIADKVGYILKELSKSHQIISITHLPQIAVFGENNLRVSKQIKETKNSKETITVIERLNREEKIKEIAKLISSEKITDASLKAAEDMLNYAEKK